MDWFLYDIGFRHKRIKLISRFESVPTCNYNKLMNRRTKSVTEFLLPGLIGTLAADRKSTDTESVTDDRGFMITEGYNYLQWRTSKKKAQFCYFQYIFL